ncbi:hypothetical protein NUW54_g4867 [Trametes sanguinea]|uniref:Uncharacterized protein n=1 Tax=Trametes sanguinea TaxID=158606 RepID=A0ACC1PX96_9APHY|nr:hypothetical protein NUW54_g4867 [Trametes sanguinea]
MIRCLWALYPSYLIWALSGHSLDLPAARSRSHISAFSPPGWCNPRRDFSATPQRIGPRKGAFGVVQDVFLLGATVTAPLSTWLEVRSVVSGRFVNGYARNDWVLNYLFRATSGGLNTVAGLRPVQNVPGLENVDVTDKISGHMSYRTFMPLILDQLGFPVSADYFDEPVVRLQSWQSLVGHATHVKRRITGT